MKYSTETINGIECYKINGDSYGNPRCVIHFDWFLTDQEKNENTIMQQYNLALERAKKIGGKAYRAAWFGGGIVFKSARINIITKKILDFTKGKTEPTYNYYKNQLSRIGHENITIKFTGPLDVTEWMNINNESINIIIEFLNTLKT